MLENTWQEFLKIVREEEGSRIVETWFKAVSFARWDHHTGSAYLSAPNKFVKDWIKNNYLAIIQEHLARLLNTHAIQIFFLDKQTTTEIIPAKKTSVDNESLHVPSVRAATQLVPAKVIKNRGSLNQNYVFDTFVVGPSNSFACTAAQAVAQKPGKFCNPFFIYGSSGLGKTHLLHAIGNYIKATTQHAKVLYQPASRFINEFINAIKFGKVSQFEAKFKELDVLLIDDIQSISNKEQTQEAFFHIFNILYDNQKQIVFSSDSYPKDIEGIEERLRSRFEWGLVADIQTPKLETKIAILKKKAELSGVHLSNEVAEYIASCASNIRVLEGSLIRVIAFASLTHQDITIELAKKVLARPEEQKVKALTLECIAKEVGKYYHVSLGELRSSSRLKELVQARQVAMFLMKELSGRSLSEIGIFLCRKNHSTVLHAYDRVALYRNRNTKVWQDIENIKKQLQI